MTLEVHRLGVSNQDSDTGPEEVEKLPDHFQGIWKGSRGIGRETGS